MLSTGQGNMNSDIRREHIISLDALRGIAAIMVVLFHTRVASSVFDLSLVRNGHMFVDFFFVLSGFVIAMNYMGSLSNGGNVGEFLAKRIARLWPLHVFTLAAFVLLDALRKPWSAPFGQGDVTQFLSAAYFDELFENFFLLHTFGDGAPNLFNGPNWSISAEFWTYVVFALVVSTFKGRWLWIMTACLGIFTALVLAGILEPHFAQNSEYGLINAIYCFILGCVGFLFYNSYLTQRPIGRPVATGLEGAVILVALLGVAAAGWAGTRVVSPLLFCIVILVMAMGRGIFSSWLSLRPMRELGKISYSIYLNHALVLFFAYPVLNRIGRQLGHDPTTPIVLDGVDTNIFDLGAMWLNNLAVLVILAVVIGSSMITYRLVELPGQRWLRKSLIRP